MSSEWNSVSLDSLGVLRVRGADVVSFLQGQLSNDIALLGPGRSLLAGYHNPQGRVVEEPARWLLVSPLAHPAPLSGCRPVGGQVWQRLAIAAGEPQVYAATSEAFVAQMLNLDVLGAIAFDKGCYTGQEIIARAHYRGRVKRRMQRFLTDAPTALEPGGSSVLPDGRSLRVVRAIAHTDGRCEFLAVTALATAEGAPGADAASGTDGSAGADRPAGTSTPPAPLHPPPL